VQKSFTATKNVHKCVCVANIRATESVVIAYRKTHSIPVRKHAKTLSTAASINALHLVTAALVIHVQERTLYNADVVVAK